jgi:ribosome-associated translation inhibitor RaiA
MEFRFHDHGQITPRVRWLAQRKARLLDRRLERVQEDLKVLDVTVGQRVRDDAYVAKLVLTIPNRTLAASGVGVAATAALRLAFDELEAQLDTTLAKVRGVGQLRRRRLAWRRPSARLAQQEALIEQEEVAAESGGANEMAAGE